MYPLIETLVVILIVKVFLAQNIVLKKLLKQDKYFCRGEKQLVKTLLFIEYAHFVKDLRVGPTITCNAKGFNRH